MDVGEWIERENCSLYIGEEWIKFEKLLQHVSPQLMKSIKTQSIIKFSEVTYPAMHEQ